MIEEIMTWLKHEPTSLNDWLELASVVLMGGILMAGIAFAYGGSNPAAVMYERSLTISEDGFWGRGWKLALFVLGETLVYQGFGMTYALDYFGTSVELLLAAGAIGILQGFLPPHHHLPVQTRVAAVFGSFILSLIFLKCGGWNSTWTSIRDALVIPWLAHLVPVAILSPVFAYNHKGQAKTTNNTPREP